MKEATIADRCVLSRVTEIAGLPHLQPGKIVFSDAKAGVVLACPLSRDELDSAYEFTTRRAAIQRSVSAWLRSLWNGCG